MLTRSVSERTGVAPQAMGGIPRSRFGLVWRSAVDPVLMSEEAQGRLGHSEHQFRSPIHQATAIMRYTYSAAMLSGNPVD